MTPGERAELRRELSDIVRRYLSRECLPADEGLSMGCDACLRDLHVRLVHMADPDEGYSECEPDCALQASQEALEVLYQVIRMEQARAPVPVVGD